MASPSDPRPLTPDPDAALRTLVEMTAERTGVEFFRTLVRSLTGILGVHGAWVTEYLRKEDRLRALAFWIDGRFVEHYEYDVEGTPCQRVIEDACLVHVPENVITLFPGDADLEPLGAVSFMGVPFLDHDGTLLGHLAVLDNRPMPKMERKEALLQIFATRAGAEYRRLRLEADLRAREDKLARLVDSAMDAIVELDPARRITLINAAGEKLFGAATELATGSEFDRFLGQETASKLSRLMDRLDDLPEGQRYLWVPGGLEARRADGTPFAAEATLSRFEAGGDDRYTLIVRNVEDRLEAERRIRSLTVEAEILREELRQLHDVDAVIGESPPMTAMLAEVRQVAATDSTVLLLGETGTGKELVARAVHAASRRQDAPLIKVNCAAIPAGLMESELFGHLKGAFTGATAAREGRFALADGGTIFLDEIGELPMDLQAKLLRVLQEGEFEPVGSSRVVKVDVRIIAATNRDLAAAAKSREFREDLFYRLNVFPIRVPPLRERGGDVALLAREFARRYAARTGRRIEPLSDASIRRLTSYEWPGNVRELQNVIERAVITSLDGTLDLDRALPEPTGERRAGGEAGPDPEAPAPAGRAGAAGDIAAGDGSGSTAGDEGDPRILTASELRELEKRNLAAAMAACGWKVSGPGGAAERLGMKPSTLSSRLKALNITRNPDRR